MNMRYAMRWLRRRLSWRKFAFSRARKATAAHCVNGFSACSSHQRMWSLQLAGQRRSRAAPVTSTHHGRKSAPRAKPSRISAKSSAKQSTSLHWASATNVLHWKIPSYEAEQWWKQYCGQKWWWRRATHPLGEETEQMRFSTFFLKLKKTNSASASLYWIAPITIYFLL